MPAADPALAQRLERYQQSRGATFLDWTADGSLLIATRFGDTEQVHRVAAPLGMREQLTFYDEPDRVGARGAQRRRASCSSRTRAATRTRRCTTSPAAARCAQLTHGDFIHGSAVWAHDGKRVAFYGNDRDSVSYDVYVADVSSGAAPQLRGRRPSGHLVSARLVAG